ncbi:MAG TPA: hypothetical protein VNA89_07350, partial [Gemmatimonadaceae bacterium]|nr:hypothetical protein [Gemmatimonadaceae bacterium]
LAGAGPRARWVCAADKLHNGSTILADLRRTQFPETIWGAFKAGREETIRWYRRVYQRLRELGFAEPIMVELHEMVTALEAYSEPEPVGRRR